MTSKPAETSDNMRQDVETSSNGKTWKIDRVRLQRLVEAKKIPGGLSAVWKISGISERTFKDKLKGDCANEDTVEAIAEAIGESRSIFARNDDKPFEKSPLIDDPSGDPPRPIPPISRGEALNKIAQQVIQPNVTELWASIDRAEGVNEVLNGLPPGNAAQLKTVYLKQMKPDVVQALISLRALDPNYLENREKTAKAVKAKLPNATIEDRYWDGLPPFHGMFAGNMFVFGFWRISDTVPGTLTVDRTEMYCDPIPTTNSTTIRYLEWLRG